MERIDGCKPNVRGYDLHNVYFSYKYEIERIVDHFFDRTSSNISGGGNLFHWASSIMGYLIRNTLLELSAAERLITVPRIFVAREESFDNVIPVLLASCRPGIMLSRRTIRN